MARMEAKLIEITLGETICEKLKLAYFKDTHWKDCYKQVAKKFSDLKRVARKFYEGKEDDEILRELRKYSVEDIKDALA